LTPEIGDRLRELTTVYERSGEWLVASEETEQGGVTSSK
jgi:hypothetical protein